MHGAVTFIATYFIVLSVLLAAWVFLALPRARKKEFVATAVIAAVLALLLAKIGSHLYYNPRPFAAGHFTPYFPHGADNGFPSDHTLLAGFLAFLAFRYSRKFGWALLAVALLIGFARVTAGVHHTVDILGSLAFSAAGVWLAGLIVERSHRRPPTYTAKKSHD